MKNFICLIILLSCNHKYLKFDRYKNSLSEIIFISEIDKGTVHVVYDKKRFKCKLRDSKYVSDNVNQTVIEFDPVQREGTQFKSKEKNDVKFEGLIKFDYF